MSYREARSLATLKAELDTAAPRRSTLSDGWIGDDAHASRDSDHNPWRIDATGTGVVGARDFTHDPEGGLDCDVLADALVALMLTGKHPALRSGAYVIWEGRIFSYDRRGEGWRPYGGSNPHDKHLHLSVATSASGYDSTRPWGVLTQEDPMSQHTDQLNRIEQKIDRTLAVVRDQRQRAIKQTTRTVKRLNELIESTSDDATKRDLQRAAKEIQDDVDELAAEVAAADAQA